MRFFSTSKTNGSFFASMACVFLLASDVSAHGRLEFPQIRLKPGDQDNGFTVARGPTTIQPCGDSVKGTSVTTFSSGASVPIQWEIGAAHKGTCFAELSTGGDANFQVLKTFPNCADTTGRFNDNVPLPNGVSCDDCTFRWRWQAALTGELYLNCANLKITGGSGGGATPTPPAPAKGGNTSPTPGDNSPPAPPAGQAPTPPAGQAPTPPAGQAPTPPAGKAPTPPAGQAPTPPAGQAPPPSSCQAPSKRKPKKSTGRRRCKGRKCATRTKSAKVTSH